MAAEEANTISDARSLRLPTKPRASLADRCIHAYGLLLFLLFVWAITQVPWEPARPSKEDDRAMYEWFCREPNQDSGPCVHARLIGRTDEHAKAQLQALLLTKAYEKQRAAMFEGWCIGQHKLREKTSTCELWRLHNLQREAHGEL